MTEPDICVSEGVTLHVIDRVLNPSTQTIANILENQSNFTRFLRALSIAQVLDFLDKEDGVSRTLFVPTDDVFDAQIPDDLFNCLMYMRYPLGRVHTLSLPPGFHIHSPHRRHSSHNRF